MALQFTVDSLESLDEDVRDLYVEENGKFRLNIDGYEDPTGLKTALQKERDASKEAKRKLGEADDFKAQFEGLDIDALKALAAKASTDEETRLLAEGKLDEVVTKRTERLRTDLERQVADANGRAEKAETFANRFRDKVLSDSIRAAAAKAGALSEAAEDIILRAKGAFKLDENGEPVAYDGEEVIYGKDGKTPLSPLEWAESLRESAPHLWPRPQGAGQTGDKQGRSTGKKRSEMSAAEVAAFTNEHGRDAYLRLPK
ncbi:hypothetical protein L1889_18280 [Paenalcaligenes niemegkensis]|uniref:hypothetical protein n=1 Tax=Paenalcaligenes niemegkensis TaxID=2895469 RepID=UPI001EE81B6C|nr:hypothetical protein [Paenalcaligenes niemegkensis]MCQ9618388.1 hypothetical protein [Paenalcaligenes niemegkensis]